jgi:hypothetical protein
MKNKFPRKIKKYIKKWKDKFKIFAKIVQSILKTIFPAWSCKSKLIKIILQKNWLLINIRIKRMNPIKSS